MILSLRPIDSWVRLEPADEIVTVILGFREHSNVPGVEHIESGECDANSFAFRLELFDVIEYHKVLLLLSRQILRQHDSCR